MGFRNTNPASEQYGILREYSVFAAWPFASFISIPVVEPEPIRRAQIKAN
jgi:hypothetical protein